MKTNGIPLLVIVAIATLLCILIAYSTNSWIFFIFGLLLGIIAISGIIIVPNDPPHIGQITRLGQRTNEYMEEGFNFLFLKGFTKNVIFFNVTKKNIDFEQVLLTPDNVTTRVLSSVSYTPDIENMTTYLNIGGEEGVNHMITDIEEEKLRTWSRSKTEGPQTWEELSNSSEEAVKAIISAICAETLPDEDIHKIHNGSGKWSVPNLGIILNRYNLTKMEPYGPVYEASIALQREKKEKVSETYEIRTELSKAKILQKQFKDDGVEKTLPEVMEIMMAWKIQREANSQISLSAITNAIFGSINKEKK